jgi:hypothetical protein
MTRSSRWCALAGTQNAVKPPERAGVVERPRSLLAVVIGAFRGGELHLGLLTPQRLDQGGC